jgi:hypothetical protein
MRLTFDWVVRETGVEIKARNGFPVPLRAEWVTGRRAAALRTLRSRPGSATHELQLIERWVETVGVSDSPSLDGVASAYARARRSIDAAHAADPVQTGDGRPAELVYADRMEAWVVRLDPAAPELLRLAARCQHLERWSLPRASFPLGKVGYLTWRKTLYTRQAERARSLLLAAGVSEGEAAEVATWVSKTGLKTNPGTQALEDAACLVFLENEISGFAAQHAEYPREKFVEILRKTWRKMSPAATSAALALDLPPAIAQLVGDAVEEGG